MALASRLAGPDNAVPCLPAADSWLSKKKPKKYSELVPSPATFQMSEHFGSGCRQTLHVGLVACLWLCLTASPGRSTHDQCTQQASGMACDSDLSRRWRGAVQQLADIDVVWESQFSCDYPCSRNGESNFFLTDLLTFFCSLPLEIV